MGRISNFFNFFRDPIDILADKISSRNIYYNLEFYFHYQEMWKHREKVHVNFNPYDEEAFFKDLDDEMESGLVLILPEDEVAFNLNKDEIERNCNLISVDMASLLSKLSVEYSFFLEKIISIANLKTSFNGEDFRISFDHLTKEDLKKVYTILKKFSNSHATS